MRVALTVQLVATMTAMRPLDASIALRVSHLIQGRWNAPMISATQPADGAF
jgi:hypothetical protein